MTKNNPLRKGFRFFLSGLRAWITQPKLMALGAAPALLVSLLYLVTLFFVLPKTYYVASWLTPFANTWRGFLRTSLRLTLGIALDVAIIVVLIVTFVSVTLLVGTVFYEKIWRHTENSLGNPPPELTISLQKQLAKEIKNSFHIFLMTLRTAFLAALLAIIPLVGGLIAGLFIAIRGTTAVALEITSFAADGRGWSLTERRAKLREHRLLVFGMGFPCYLACLIPLGAVLIMPSAVIAGTLLIRELSTSQHSSPAEN